MQLFKRVLFNTCNVLISKDSELLNKCIKGVMELFYPLTSEIVCIPNLPESMMEYVNMCGQCVIGVVQDTTLKKKSKSRH